MLQKIRTIRQSELFRDVHPELASKIEALGQIRTCANNELVHREGEQATAIFLVLEGIVRLTRADATYGREADVAICEPGDTFAEYLLAEGATYATSARAPELTRVVAFDLERLRALAVRNPVLQANAARITAQHLKEAFLCISADRLQTAQQKVAQYFLGRCPEGVSQASFRLPYQKRVLAGKLGLAPEALSRAFVALAGSGASVRGRHVEVSSVELLKARC